MPLSAWEAVNGKRILSEGLEIPSQKLIAEQVDAFLGFMFSDVLQRAEPVTLQEGASVAHYLWALSRVLPERGDRVRMLRQTQLLWRVLLDAPWKSSSKTAARRFLARHTNTHLSGLDVEWLQSMLDEAPPLKAKESAQPQMMSKNMAVSGKVNPHLLDDLSERIYAAYYALRLNKIPDARGQIAEALNAKGIRPKSQGGKQPWDGDHVVSRIKQFERRLVKEDDRSKTNAIRSRERRQKADFWIYLFLNDEPSGEPARPIEQSSPDREPKPSSNY